ncbi:MAG: 30S ribosomal protein S17e [Desulfurococcales archaeon]|jgi:small subunit ribosomal protein S17e|nr:30S ribosomal protein S17e [Desulfurococcales archaeon]
MGKVRPTPIKRISRELLEKYPDIFTKDFQKNKEVLKAMLRTQSKKVRNQIAGYITHLIRVREKMQEKGAESVEEVQE